VVEPLQADFARTLALPRSAPRRPTRRSVSGLDDRQPFAEQARCFLADAAERLPAAVCWSASTCEIRPAASGLQRRASASRPHQRNLLVRANRELGADDPASFAYALYRPDAQRHRNAPGQASGGRPARVGPRSSLTRAKACTRGSKYTIEGFCDLARRGSRRGVWCDRQLLFSVHCWRLAGARQRLGRR